MIPQHVNNSRRSIETAGNNTTEQGDEEEGRRRAQGATEDIGFPVVATPADDNDDSRNFSYYHGLLGEECCFPERPREQMKTSGMRSRNVMVTDRHGISDDVGVKTCIMQAWAY